MISTTIKIIWGLALIFALFIGYEIIMLAQFIETEGLKETLRLLWEGSGK